MWLDAGYRCLISPASTFSSPSRLALSDPKSDSCIHLDLPPSEEKDVQEDVKDSLKDSGEVPTETAICLGPASPSSSSHAQRSLPGGLLCVQSWGQKKEKRHQVPVSRRDP